MTEAVLRRWSALSFRSSLLSMLAAGGLNLLSFAPYGCWPLQILSLSMLFSLWLRDDAARFSRRQAAGLGWAYSFAWLALAVGWLLVAMTRYGGMPLWLAVPALAMLAAALGLYAALVALAAAYLRQRWRLSPALLALLALPALWTLGEWLRGWVLTGFPWTISGYAHTASPLAGFAPVLGVLGLSWLNAVLAGLLALVAGGVGRKAAAAMLLAGGAVLAAGAGLRTLEWTAPHGQPIGVRLLQGNVEQDMKFNPEHLNESLRLYHEMILAAPADLVATPETALPMLSSQLPPDYLPRLNAFAQDTGSAVVLGLGVHDGGKRYSNSVLGFARAHAAQAYRYDKHHLVPFGEFVPTGFRWFVDLMRIPLGDFSSAGLLQPSMQVRDQLVLPDICYENLFGEEIARQLAAQAAGGGQAATILLNVSNLAWYGDSLAIPQHLQISQMRVLETGRPMLNVTNTGATAVIAAGGSIAAQLPPLTRATLASTVQGRSGLTPYVRWGNSAVLGIVLLSLLLAYSLGRRAGRE
ncbi:MAG: apolipoprotein N-acyltransferase [Burkholderiales bacterium]|nr:apolipoprotein N-acyltransferase [Burkholderiales bacterium]